MNDSENPLSTQKQEEPTTVSDTPIKESTTPVATPVAPTSAEPAETKKTSKKSHMWLYVLIAVVVIAAGLGTWYAVHKSNNQNSNTKKDISLLTYGFNNNPLNTFYPGQNALESGTTPMDEQMFEGLVEFNNGTQIVPVLAASWTNPNTTTWIFNLKHNIYYHDGDTLTAQDVVYTWQQVNSTDQDLASFATPTIKNVQAENNYTVEITTSAPDPVLLNRLTNLWIIDSKAPKGTQPWELGTGPYTVKPGTTPTANNIDLVAFNKWHGGNIYTKALDYVFYADPSKAVTDLNAGKIDLADNITTANANQLKTGLQALTPPSLFVDYIAFDTLNPSYAVANPKIRQAIDLTINPAAVLKAYGVAGTPIDQVVPSQVPGYNPAITRPAINLTEAKQLVQEVNPNGVTINLAVGEPAQAAGQEIVSELKAIGITVNLVVATDEGTFFNDIAAGDYQMFYEGNGTQIADASDVLANWQQAPFYDNTTFDSQLTKADQTFDPSQRLVDLQQASQTLISDNAYIPLFQHSYMFATKSNIVYPLGTYDNDLNTYFSSVYQK